MVRVLKDISRKARGAKGRLSFAPLRLCEIYRQATVQRKLPARFVELYLILQLTRDLIQIQLQKILYKLF